MIMEDVMTLITIACDIGESVVNFQFTNRKQAEQFYWDTVRRPDVLDTTWKQETVVYKGTGEALDALMVHIRSGSA